MNPAQHTGRLVLAPVDPYLLPEEPQDLLRGLREIGFIDQALNNAPGYLLGEHFMQLVTFMGCSPSIKLEPPSPGESFCHLRLDGPYPRPKLMYGKNTQPPRCQSCRKRLNDWRASFATWEESTHGSQTSCPHCGHNQDPMTYDFRQSAGCARLFLLVENIFPQEAIPSPALLTTLKRVTNGADWHHFYQQD
jgi:DNA-directed RNA polymerase subunit RPC12/RpoP